MAPARRARNPWWILLAVVLLGGVLGSVVAEALVGYPAAGFLTRDVRAGLDPPVTVDLGLVTFTLGATLRLNLAVVVGVILAIWIFRLLA